MNNETGGPAFPSELAYPNPGAGPKTYHAPGMTLRDYFAAKAMQIKFGPPNHSLSLRDMAKVCYEMADAMLEARK